jgi:DNA (cytosine-5)-methyltransferase 1
LTKAVKPRLGSWESHVAGGTADFEFLRLRKRPDYESGLKIFTIVDLFSGCGGMALGLAHAVHRLGFAVAIPLAMDVNPDAVTVFRSNFPRAHCEAADVCDRFGGKLRARTMLAEQQTKALVGGMVDALVGGPPCQGNSNLNNHTRREDPRNALYARMARAAFVLGPRFVIIENVPSVQLDKGNVVEETVTELERLDYTVDHGVIDLARAGVPQHRRRHLVVASADPNVSPTAILDALDAGCVERTRDLHWAIRDLEYAEPKCDFERASTPSCENSTRIDWLFENESYDLPDEHRPACHRDKDHKYKSIYGRLRWDQPAPTITTGFLSMGQGRNVHPSRRRTITPHEAARVQCFPDFFSFGAVSKRTSWSTLIGNAVPPLLTLRMGELIFGLAEPGIKGR